MSSPSISKKTLDRFVAELETGASVTEACQTTYIGRSTAYTYRSSDDDFAARWDAAIEMGTDRLEKEAIRRAMDGSDTLMQFLLRGRRRGTYGERVEVNARIEAVTSGELAAARAAALADPEAFANVAARIAAGIAE